MKKEYVNPEVLEHRVMQISNLCVQSPGIDPGDEDTPGNEGFAPKRMYI